MTSPPQRWNPLGWAGHSPSSSYTFTPHHPTWTTSSLQYQKSETLKREYGGWGGEVQNQTKASSPSNTSEPVLHWLEL